MKKCIAFSNCHYPKSFGFYDYNNFSFKVLGYSKCKKFIKINIILTDKTNNILPFWLSSLDENNKSSNFLVFKTGFQIVDTNTRNIIWKYKELLAFENIAYKNIIENKTKYKLESDTIARFFDENNNIILHLTAEIFYYNIYLFSKNILNITDITLKFIHNNFTILITTQNTVYIQNFLTSQNVTKTIHGVAYKISLIVSNDELANNILQNFIIFGLGSGSCDGFGQIKIAEDLEV